MAITSKIYSKVFLAVFNKEIDWLDDNIRAVLLKSTYTPDQDVHDYLDDLVLATNEATGTGYAAGGTALTSKTITYTAATNKIMLDAADVSWPGASFTARTLVIADYTPGSDATRPLITYAQSDVDITASGGPWTAVFAAAGIVEITVG